MLLLQPAWPFPGSAGFGRAPGESHALPGSSLVAGRPLPSHRSKWKELGSPVLSATSATPSARTGLLAQCPQRGRVAQGEQTSCACMSRHLCSWTCLTGRGCFLFLHDNLKRLCNQAKGRAWMDVPQVVPHALPFHWGRKFCPPCQVGPTNFTLKSFQPLEYWSVTQMWLNPEEKSRYKTSCRV